jgi:hypothetical protein
MPIVGRTGPPTMTTFHPLYMSLIPVPVPLEIPILGSIEMPGGPPATDHGLPDPVDLPGIPGGGGPSPPF